MILHMKEAVIPPPLKKGDTIGVFAPSSYVEAEDIEKSKAVMEEAGYKVFVHPQTYERHHQSAGNVLQKSLAFQGLWQRADINAIWTAGGGNRCTHLLESINFAKLAGKPKALIGFSDVTPLLNAVFAHTGIVTYHAQVFKNLHKYKELHQCLTLLSEGFASCPMDEAQVLYHGKATGHLVGGNLSLFQYLPQTLPNDFYEGAILFLEDCNEELSKLDRMFLHLRRTGVLSSLSALALGQFSDLAESGRPFGFTLEDLIKEHTDGLEIPIIMNLPFGHAGTLIPLPIGDVMEINTKKGIFRTITS